MSTSFPSWAQARSWAVYFPTLSVAMRVTSVLLAIWTIAFFAVHAPRLLHRPPQDVVAPQRCALNAPHTPGKEKNSNSNGETKASKGEDGEANTSKGEEKVNDAPSTGATLCNCRTQNNYFVGDSSIEGYLPWGCSVVQLPTGYLLFDTKDDVLLRYFSPAFVTNFKQRLDDRIEVLRDNAYRERKAAIDAAASAAVRNPGEVYPYPFNILTRANNINPSTQSPQEIYQTAPLENIISWMKHRRPDVSASDQKVYDSVVGMLKTVQVKEEQVSLYVLSTPLTLDDVLNFRWLYMAEGGWLIELFFLSTFGVLVQALTVLIRLRKNASCDETGLPLDSGYCATKFVLIFPRLAMAPMVAVVVLSMVVSGITGIKLTLSNLPVFLFFAFLLGFANDRLIGVLRAAVKHFVPRMAPDDTAINKTYGDEARRTARSILSTFQKQTLTPNTLDELRVIAKDEVLAEATTRFASTNRGESQ